MPAKGWRKDEQESNFETAVDNEKISIDSLLFPKTTVNKIAKQVLTQTDGTPMILAKDSQTVIQRASVVFINYIYDAAKQLVKEKGRKVVNADDILLALEQTNFNSFVPVLKEGLEAFTIKKQKKKQEKENEKKKKEEEGAADDAGEKGDGSNKRAKLANGTPGTTSVASGVIEADDATEEEDIEDHEDKEKTEEPEDEDDDDDTEEAPVLTASQKLQQEQKDLEGDSMQEDDEDDDDTKEEEEED
ncbi:unnamed protein product [Ambrosiozyma monospora]|uniref:DNA polymerase epsilon subunit D n=1 Tax=Ambrosiozyma monospora TaxID=43982 RepID=A0A9W6YW03_AMBMO|nr:unnamed protein product [Ambrosiozyma monospora]